MNGRKTGRGLIYEDISYLEGIEKLDNEPTEQLVYNGNFKDGDFFGFGVLKPVDNLSEYSGYFLKGKKHGIGLLKESKTLEETELVAEFLEGKPHGICKIETNSGEIYIGNLRYGIKDGLGYQSFIDGSSYFGDWKNGERTGFGITVQNGSVYKGSFMNGKPNGLGVQK